MVRRTTTNGKPCLDTLLLKTGHSGLVIMGNVNIEDIDEALRDYVDRRKRELA